jgi:biopolymer transport protein ExbB
MKHTPFRAFRGLRAYLALPAAMLFFCAHVAAQTHPTTAETIKAEAPEDVSFLQLLLKGGWFLAPIGACSLIGLALILERSIALRRTRIIPRAFMPGLKLAAPDGGNNYESAVKYCRQNPSPIARVIAAGVRKLPQGHAAVERAIDDAGSVEVQKLRRNLKMMYGVSAVAPMLGLLGTVWGMIDAFRITSSSRGLGRPELLAKGIYEALVCTLAGLMVAIPMLMFYYYFSAKVERTLGEMNDVSLEFVEHFLDAEQGRKV